FFFFSSRRRHTRFSRDWSSDVCSSDLVYPRGNYLVLAHAVFLHARGRKCVVACVGASVFFGDRRAFLVGCIKRQPTKYALGATRTVVHLDAHRFFGRTTDFRICTPIWRSAQPRRSTIGWVDYVGGRRSALSYSGRMGGKSLV